VLAVAARAKHSGRGSVDRLPEQQFDVLQSQILHEHMNAFVVAGRIERLKSPMRAGFCVEICARIVS
jgi:hypothetical protein